MKIPLTRGKFAIVDTRDFARLSKFRWFATDRGGKRWYAQRRLPRDEGGHVISMEEMILKVGDGLLVDHKNLNGLDNRRRNLRAATKAQNQQNSEIKAHNTSGFKGVSFVRRKVPLSNPWRARIVVDRKEMWLGYFQSADSAACAYDKAARKHFGEFARCNF